MHIKRLGLVIAFSAFICSAGAQSMSPDTPVYSNAAAHVINNYFHTIAGQSELYNGVEYRVLPPAYKGSPYFNNKPVFVPGIVHYNDSWYKNVPVLYDIYADAMVSELNDTLYVLRAEKIWDVYLSGHHFVYLDNGGSQGMPTGFYDQVYSGKSEVLVKRVRTVQNNVTAESVNVIYENGDIIYMKHGANFMQVSSKGSVLDVLKDKNKQLKQYLGDNKIKYNKDREAAIIKLAAWYDRITN